MFEETIVDNLFITSTSNRLERSLMPILFNLIINHSGNQEMQIVKLVYYSSIDWFFSRHLGSFL